MNVEPVASYLRIMRIFDDEIRLLNSQLRLGKKSHAKAMVAASVKLLKPVYWVLRAKWPYHG